MAQMYHTQNSQRSRPRWLGVTLAISVAAALVLFLPRLIGGMFPSAGASPPPGAAWPGMLTTGDQLRTAGTHTMFLPLLYNYLHAPLNCTPQVWYTFSSFGSTPMGMAYDVSRTRLFVANYAGLDAGSLAVINAGSGQKIRVVDDMPEAHAVAFDAKRNRIYVVGGLRLSVVDGASYRVLAKIPIGVNEPAGAYAVAYNPATDKIYVTGFQDNSITIVDATTWGTITKITRREIVEPADIVVNPDTNKVYVSNHNHGAPNSWVTVIDGNTDALLRSIPLSGDLYGIAVDSVYNLVYVTSISAARVYVIDGSTNTRIGDIQIVRAEDKRPMPLCMAPLNLSTDNTNSEDLRVMVNDYSHPHMDR